MIAALNLCKFSGQERVDVYAIFLATPICDCGKKMLRIAFIHHPFCPALEIRKQSL